MFEKLRVLLGMMEVRVTSDEEHAAVYKRGCRLIEPYMLLSGPTSRVDWWGRKQITSGIRDLDAVTEYNPQNWPAFWIKGKAYQALNEPYMAYAQFHACFTMQKENPDVARELALSCLDIGKAQEATEVTLHAIGLTPEDAGLHANLALAYLLLGENEKALNAIKESLKIDPDDSISKTVEGLVVQVVDGKRPQPKSMADLQKP